MTSRIGGARDHLLDLRRRIQDRRQMLASRTWSTVPADAVPFLDPIDEICEEPPPRHLRAVHFIAVAMFVSLLLVAWTVRVDVVVTTSGRLITNTAPIVVQPMERAIIREIAVKPGDVVSKGQVLATLDPTFAHADMASLEVEQHAVLARLRRLDAETAGSSFAPGAALDDRLQAALYDQRQAERAARLASFDEEVARLRASQRTTENARASLAQQVEVAGAVSVMRATLLQQKNGSRLQYLEAEGGRLRAERELHDAGDRMPELEHAVQSKLAERQNFVASWQRELSESLVAARAEAGKVTEALSKAARLNDLVKVTAAQDGVVLEVARLSEGSVLREAEQLMTIIPSSATLIAEVMISSADVGYTSPDVEVELKVDAYPYQNHGILRGRLLSVSEDSFSAGTGPAAAPGSGAFHRGRVQLLRTTLDHMPGGARLFPGMTLVADIKVGSRSAMAYFLSPITRGLHESLREP